jgi:polyisoprenyl-phosphate glycosyltransferase
MSLRNMRERVSTLGAWLRSADGLAYLALMAVALGVRLYLAPRVMVSFDMGAYEYWGQLANQDLFHVYSLGSHGPNWTYYPAYPPVAIYLYGLLDKIVFGMAALVGHPLAHNVPRSEYLRLMLKLPGIAADLVFLTFLYVKATQVFRRRWVAWLLSATYALSPGILITVVFWGQTDGLVLLLIVAGLFFALRQQPIWCGVFLALAVNFKPQPVVFVPLALFYLWRWGSLRLAVRAVMAFLAVTLVVWLPYLMPPFGEVRALVANLSAAETAEGLTASHTAWNLWSALGIQGQSVATPLLGPITISQVGYLLLLLVILIAVVGVWRDPRPVQMWAGAALIALAFFTVATLQFERYLFPALGLFFLAALYDRRYWLPYAVVSVTYMVNFSSELLNCGCDPYFSRVPQHLHRVLTLHLDPWQGGAINCIMLVISVIFFLWPKVAAAAQQATAQSGERAAQRQPGMALAPVGVASGVSASSALTGMATMTTLGGAGSALSMATVMQPDTMRMKVVSHGPGGDGAKGIKDIADSHRPRLRLRPRELGRPPYVSVVIPCYNEQGNVLPMYERLSAALREVTPSYELIFVNNGSYDHSPELFEELASRDQRVSILTLSRNFGSQGAYTAGFAYASGDCVVGLDGDIQDPPELIPALVARWLEGYDVVYGIRARRKGSLPRRIGYKLFYRLLRRLSYVDIPVDASDFGLMDRRVVNVLNEMPERSRLIRGLRAFAGFSQTGVPYERAERHSGFTTNSFLGLFRWASLGIVSFSFAPLDLISYLAGGVVALMGVAIVVYMALFFLQPGAPRGFQTLLMAVLFLGAVQLLCLSIIGTYLGKVFEEVKARPRYLVHDVLNDHRRADHSQL